MKVKEIDASIERQIVTQAITSTKFLREVSLVLKPLYMKSSYAKIVLSWVLEYWRVYKEAPGKHIQDLYKKNASTIRDEDDTELISEFLLRLSKDYENNDVHPERDNTPFLVDNAVQYLKLRALEGLKDQIDESLLQKNPLKGEQAISNFSRVETPRDKGVSLLDDSAQVASAFLEEEDVLFRFPGILGTSVGLGAFCRGDLIAFLAAPKKGKSWWEWYVGQLALYHGFRVALINLEMTHNQYIRRTWVSLVGQPRRRRETQRVRSVMFPTFYREGEEDKWEVRVEERDYETIDLSSVKKLQSNFRRQFRAGQVRIFTFPAYSATVESIEATLDNLYYYDGFLPDVIIVDYADLIVPSRMYGEYRHQLDEIWKRLRGMAQKRNSLTVTATQAGRAAFTQDASEKDVAEDIRKIAHVGKLISINQTKEEREKGVCRIQQLIERDDRIGGRKIVVLQCLDLGQVCLDSRLESDVLGIG